MSMLKIYRPDENSEAQDNPVAPYGDGVSPVEPVDEAAARPVIYSFRDWVARLRDDSSHGLAERARSIHSNCLCPQCRRPTVVPLTLNDGRIDSAGNLVPGSASLVGFRCAECEHEWPASPSADRRLQM